MRTAINIFLIYLTSLLAASASIDGGDVITPKMLLQNLPDGVKNKYGDYNLLNAPKQINWLEDYREAIKLAGEQKKNVFMYFYKAKSKFCKQISEEFLSDDYKKFLSQFICLKVEESNIWSLYYVQASATIIIIDCNLNVLLDVCYWSYSKFGRIKFWNQPIYDELPPSLERKYNPWCVILAKWKIPLGTDKSDVMKILKPYKISKRYINENGIVYCIFEKSGEKYEVPHSFKTGKQICATSGWTFKPITVKHEMIVCWLPGIICGGATYVYFNRDEKVEDVSQGGT